jgi:RNase P/RNase MRP subunit p29
MIVLGTGGPNPISIPKRSVTLEISIPDNQKVRIEGNEIIGRPENRIKMKKRKNARKL